MRYGTWLVVVAVLAVSPAVALAHRPASRSERAALTRAFNSYAHPERVPQRCLRFVISTARSGWAQLSFKLAHPPHGCTRYLADGVSIFHFTRGHWRFVTAGSSFVGSNGGCHVPKVPRSVARDFRLC